MATRVRFGDEYSTLLDEFERKSFEAHLNRSMMMGRRSFSEPGGRRMMMMMIQSSPSLLISMPPPPPPIPLVTQQEVMIMEHNNNNNNNSKKHSSSSGSLGFQRVLKKLFKPFIGRKNTNNKHVPHHDLSNKDLLISSKEFSKSLRF
ncbi:hypothetical protein HN51_005457 [Arachis hypogaea]|nr:uncharacterized protein DS421_4g127210 [Arachis hypogaea]QHO39224.1 uncharacterized protein DS421_4g127240 [Arachis hypogaea]